MGEKTLRESPSAGFLVLNNYLKSLNYWYIPVSVHLAVWLSVYLAVWLSVHLAVWLSVHPSKSILIKSCFCVGHIVGRIHVYILIQLLFLDIGIICFKILDF